MSTDFRALCAELLDEFVYHTDWSDAEELKARARFLLSEPADGPPAGAEGEDISELFYRHCCEVGDEGVGIVAQDAPAFARAVLARWGNHSPDATKMVPPAEGEMAELVLMLHHAGDALRLHGVSGTAKACDRAAELLERHAAPVPVSVAERLPGPEDCDAEGRCWLHGKVEGDWRLINPAKSGVPHLRYCFSHWLPASALPLPLPQGGEVEP